MIDVTQELMTPQEAAKWFRRSPSWLRQQGQLLRVGGPNGQPLFHVQVCRAYVMGKLCGFNAIDLRRVQIRALANACGLTSDQAIGQILGDANRDEPLAAAG